MNRRLFFYGTLMSRQRRGHLIGQLATPVGPATVRGLLYDVGFFPALVDGDGVVHGELWEARSDWAMAAALETTDAVEGYREGDHGSMYRRVERRLLCAECSGSGCAECDGSGESAEPPVWTYVWNGSLDGLAWIPGGCWRTRHGAVTAR